MPVTAPSQLELTLSVFTTSYLLPPSKSRINLQSIGRVLRKGEGKDMAILYDIADDIGGQNYTLKHLNERVNIYNDENFRYEVIKVNLRAN